jgi:hypothetical protein
MDESTFLMMYDDVLHIQDDGTGELRQELGQSGLDVTASISPTKTLDYDALDRWLGQKIAEEPWSSFQLTNCGTGAGKRTRAKL